jgi:hypothetical protein
LFYFNLLKIHLILTKREDNPPLLNTREVKEKEREEKREEKGKEEERGGERRREEVVWSV